MSENVTTGETVVKNLRKMTNEQLWAFLEQEAKKVGAKAVGGPFGSIELEAPEGMRWSPDLHVLVTAPWDNDTERSCLMGAIRDLRNNIPHLEKCDEQCACKETEDEV